MTDISTVVFRVDASRKLATGHVMRCLTLADELISQSANLKITFVCCPLPQNLKQLLNQRQIALIELGYDIDSPDWNQAKDSDNCISIFKTLDHIDLLIVDHYYLDISWQKALAPFFKKLCIIDDLADRHHQANYLVDQTFGRLGLDYMPWLNPECQTLVGADYTLLRKTFLANRNKAKNIRASVDCIKRIFISLGGVDEHNTSSKIIHFLANAFETKLLPLFEIDLVISSAAPYLAQLHSLSQQYAWLKLHVDTQAIAELMLAADLAIGASGSTTWERCCLGLPSLAIVLAENQQLINRNLAMKGALTNLGHYSELNQERLISEIQYLNQNNDAYQKMAEQAFDCSDGAGVQRVARRLLSAHVSLRKANIDDIKTVFDWQSNPVIRQFSRNPNPVKWQEHEAWFTASIVNEKRHIYIIECQNEPAGVLRLDKLTDKSGYEISILVAPKWQGQHVALKAIHLIEGQFLKLPIHAWVSPQNTASVKLFKQANFTQVASDHFIRPAYDERLEDN